MTTSLRVVVTQVVRRSSSASNNRSQSYDVARIWSESSADTSPATTAVFRLIEQFESREPAILKVALMCIVILVIVIVMCIVILVNLFGNGASLMVIWKTPKLHTKTFALLFNLAAVDLVVGLTLVGYGFFTVVVYVFDDNPCTHLVSIVVMIFLPRYPTYVSMNSVGLITYERYIAIALPLRYETLVTDRTVKVAIALVWTLCLPLTVTFLLLPNGIDWRLCSVVSANRQALVTDVACLLTAFTVIGGLYANILIIARRQRAKINAQMAEVQTATSGSQSAVIAAGRKLRTELKAVRLTACVVGAVVVLWTPYLIGDLILVSGINPLLGQYVTDVGSALGPVNTSINWIIYGLASRDFRLAAMRLVGCRPATVALWSVNDNGEMYPTGNKPEVDSSCSRKQPIPMTSSISLHVTA